MKPILSLRTLCLTLPLCTPALAQTVQVSAAARTDILVKAEDGQGKSDSLRTTSGTPLPSGFSAQASVGVNKASLRSDLSGGSFKMLAQTVADGAFPNRAEAAITDGVSVAPPTLAYRFSASSPVAGRLVIVMAPRAGMSVFHRAYAHVAVTVGAHPTFSANTGWALPVTREVGLVLDPQGVEVLVQPRLSLGSSIARVSAEIEVEVRFVPGQKVTSYGRSCAQLHSGFPRPGEIELFVQTSNYRAQTMLAFGSAPLDLRFMSLSCRLLVDPLLIVPLGRTDSTGALRQKFTLPHTKVDTLVQAAVWSQANQLMQTTNGLRLDLN